MAELKISNRDTTASTNRGSSSIQSYLGTTVRSVASTPSGYNEARNQIGTITTDWTLSGSDLKPNT